MTGRFARWMQESSVTGVTGGARNTPLPVSAAFRATAAPPPAPPCPIVGVSSPHDNNASVSADSHIPPPPPHLLHLPEQDMGYWREQYAARAAHHEYDASIPRAEAERLSYQFTLHAFITRYYPLIAAQYDAVLHEREL